MPLQAHAQIKGLGKTLPDAAEVLVFKKWVGATGDEAPVEIQLVCQGLDDFHPLRINQDQPDGWLIAEIPKNGSYCSVFEEGRESFIADERDCRDLLVLPGSSVECTLVNTKRVKRIEMLNRYGIVMMIAFILGAGLAAVHRQLH
ncbi:MAG TPA: hypothetical protein VFG52_08685 [Xanthomonadales bacterium]|nr:hypothetical protein [Xanthomonadales bacterium]